MPAQIAEELEIINEQITHTRKVLNDKKRFYCPACERHEMQPQHMAQLLKALDTLLDRRRKLTGRFNPGTLRNPEPTKRTNHAGFQPQPGDLPEPIPSDSPALPQESPGSCGGQSGTVPNI